jgi:hypothetical protein
MPSVSVDCKFKVHPLPHAWCNECMLNGCYPWNRNPFALCSEMGGLAPVVLVHDANTARECAQYKKVTIEIWMRHLSDLQQEAALNEEVRERAAHGEAYSSDLLPAEYVAMKRRLKAWQDK